MGGDTDPWGDQATSPIYLVRQYMVFVHDQYGDKKAEWWPNSTLSFGHVNWEACQVSAFARVRALMADPLRRFDAGATVQQEPRDLDVAVLRNPHEACGAVLHRSSGSRVQEKQRNRVRGGDGDGEEKD